MNNQSSAMTLLKATFEEIFADKTRVVDVLNADGSSSSSLTNEEFRLQISGTNVNLEEIANIPYDRLQLKMTPRSLDDLANNSNLTISQLLMKF